MKRKMKNRSNRPPILIMILAALPFLGIYLFYSFFGQTKPGSIFERLNYNKIYEIYSFQHDGTRKLISSQITVGNSFLLFGASYIYVNRVFTEQNSSTTTFTNQLCKIYVHKSSACIDDFGNSWELQLPQEASQHLFYEFIEIIVMGIIIFGTVVILGKKYPYSR